MKAICEVIKLNVDLVATSTGACDTGDHSLPAVCTGCDDD